MRLLHTSDWHRARIFTAKAARPNTTLFLPGYWTARRSMKSTPLSWLAIFLIPARRRATPANCITVSSSSCSRPAVARWCWRATTTRWRCSMNPAISSPFLHTTVVANAGYAPIELPLRDGTPGAIFCPVPFLRPRELVTSQAGHSGREKQQLLLHAISDYYQEQYQQACALRGDRPLPIIASGHLTTVGASKSDAVRDIYIGTLDAFPAQHFPPCRLHCAGPYSPGADGRRLRAYPLQRLAAAAELR